MKKLFISDKACRKSKNIVSPLTRDMHYTWLIKLKILPGTSFCEDGLIRFDMSNVIWYVPGKIDIILK